MSASAASPFLPLAPSSSAAAPYHQEGCLPFGFARLSNLKQSIVHSLTHSLSFHPISLPPSLHNSLPVSLDPPSLPGRPFIPCFLPCSRAGPLSRLRKGKAVPPLPHLGAYYIIYNGPTPLHSTSSHSLALSLLYFLGSLSLSLPVARRRQALRCRSFQMVQIAVMNKLNLRLPALQGRPLYLPFGDKRGSSFGLKKSVTFALAISDAL